MSTDAFDFLSEIINEGRYAEAASLAHDAWREEKEAQGWRYGRRRNEKKKRHPLLLPFEDLTEQQQISNNLSAYSTTNFFRRRYKGASLAQLKSVLEDLLEGKHKALMDELGEYVHSHFTASMIGQQKTVAERADMVVYEDLEAPVQELDLVIARATMRYLLREIEAKQKD
jgi:hypothetical protein